MVPILVGTEEANILDFSVSDEGLERTVANAIFSLGNYTDVRECPIAE
jgi:hypothetical protein